MALFAALAGIGSALIGANSAKKAASAQEKTAADQIRYSEQTRDLIRSDLAPYRETGNAAHNALAYEYGVGDQPSGYSGYQASPGYEYATQQAQRAVEGSAAARGGLYSGSTMGALQDRSQGMANMDYNNWLSGLRGLAGTGQNAAAMSANAYTNSGQTVNSALASAGNAQSAGYIGQANAINNGIGNALSTWQYQQTANPGSSGGLFGGNSWG